MKKGDWEVSNKRGFPFFMIRVLPCAVMPHETCVFSSLILHPSSFKK